MEETKTIHDLDMHEKIYIDTGVSVRRVPGGWIYMISNGSYSDTQLSSVFVPYQKPVT